jgi:phenol 2-monooxygenase
MQFYLDGYRPGDPTVADAHPSAAERPETVPDECDVLIVGCGPAGLVLAAQLAAFPGISTVIVDRRDGPLQVGQADGVACRTVEMFEAFGLARRLVDEAYAVNEVCFWQPDPAQPGRIRRAGRVDDVEEGLSEMPHVIVNQARMLAYLLDYMQRSPTRLRPYYGWRAEGAQRDGDGVVVTMSNSQTEDQRRVRARYVVGCDGARSTIRQAMGRELTGDPMNVSWGVMDVLAVTDFPDIRLKAVIQSAEHGSVLIIPREGGYLVRLYIELDDDRDVTPAKLTATANRILHPYTLDVKDVGWWSVYEIGQRLCSRFDDSRGGGQGENGGQGEGGGQGKGGGQDQGGAEGEGGGPGKGGGPSKSGQGEGGGQGEGDGDGDGGGGEGRGGLLPRMFIAGDACHTHSAKAGQGMNVSMADAWNLGWKLAAVLRGSADPELLSTYSDERQKVAAELIDFDRKFAGMFSARPRDSGDEFQRYFVTQGRFTAGVATRYAPSLITADTPYQSLAVGFPVGMRFHSAPVIRLADAKPLQLGHVARADGQWRLYLFGDRNDFGDRGDAGDRGDVGDRDDFGRKDDPRSPIARLCIEIASMDLDVRAVFQQGHRDLAVDRMPELLLPRKGRFGLRDYEKMFCPDPRRGDIFDLRGIDRDRGCMILVRPDQYVAHVLPLTAADELTAFVAGVNRTAEAVSE